MAKPTREKTPTTVDLRRVDEHSGVPATTEPLGQIERNPYNLLDNMDFGRFAGFKVQQVIERYPRYIGWCLDNVDWFWLSKQAYQAWRAALARDRQMRSRERQRATKVFTDQDCIDDYFDHDWCTCP